ncbi:MAG: hypothetical protein ABI556_10800 [Gemmatimonadales bacterium]
MNPQSSFMVLAPIIPERESALRDLLATMNVAPGRVNADNTLIPFSRCETLHFARFVILDDNTLEDVAAYGLAKQTYPLYLAFLGDVDGEGDHFLEEIGRLAENGLREIFSCCEGVSPDTDLIQWMKSYRAPAVASYVNWQGRTVGRVREEAALRNLLGDYLQDHATELTGRTPREIQATLKRFVNNETASGRIRLTAEDSTPLDWRLRDLLHLVGVPLLFILASPLIIVAAPLFVTRLRNQERTDPELCERVDDQWSDQLASLEDHDVTNQFTAMGSLKPGFVRLCTTILVLSLVDYAARHVFTRGRLARIRTIHFARWVFLDGRRRMVFFSNYDGTVESYMDDFINKTGFGLNAVFTNGIGYPRTSWLVLGGCEDERKYKDFLRRHTLPTQVWYKAYPGLTAIDLERNGRIRKGLESSSMSDKDLREWAALL